MEIDIRNKNKRCGKIDCVRYDTDSVLCDFCTLNELNQN